MEQVVFAHISDPHFAAERITDAPVRAMGQNGHDLLLCQELPAALEHLRDRTGLAENVKLPLVMSGDLTRTGLNPQEFETGCEFLEEVWPNPSNLPTRRYGLGLGSGRIIKIPGNHDHWDGDIENMWGFNGAIKPLFFPQTPFQVNLRNSRGGKLIVELFGLDSGSGFPPIGASGNLRARGMIHREELDALTRMLATSASRRINDRKTGLQRVRAIVCHHSLQGNWLLGWFFGSLEMEGNCQRTLKYLAGRYEVSAILTGHAHDFLAERYDLFPFHNKLREYRSATTLQAPARYFKQGFYGHRIRLDHRDHVWWTAYPYEWQGSYFYPLPVEERVPPIGDWNPFHFRVT